MQTCKGSIHDFKLYKDTCPDWLPENTNYLADSGYQGIANLHKQTFTPFKKPRGGQLLEICKQANHYLAKFRIVVEHKIGLIKLFKIVAHKYRNRRQRYDLRMKLFAGIINSELNLWLLQEVYWTNSTTHGEIEMNLVDRKALSIDSFISAETHVDSLNIS